MPLYITPSNVLVTGSGKLPAMADLEILPTVTYSEEHVMNDAIGRKVARPDTGAAESSAEVSTPAFEREYPKLYRFLVEKRGTGQTYSTGCLVLFVEAGCYKLCLNDRPYNRSAFVSGKTFGLALGAAEAGISSGRVQWRKKGYKPREQQQTLFA